VVVVLVVVVVEAEVVVVVVLVVVEAEVVVVVVVITPVSREAFEMDIVTRPEDATLEDYEQVTRCDGHDRHS
jgi:hypothetical protein